MSEPRVVIQPIDHTDAWRAMFSIFVQDRQVAWYAQLRDGRWRAHIAELIHDETFRTDAAARRWLFLQLDETDPGEITTVRFSEANQ